MHVECPSVLTEGNVAEFLRLLQGHALKQPDLTIGFKSLSYAHPLGTLYLAQGIRSVVDARRQYGRLTRAAGADGQRPVHGYLKHIGFFSWIGLKLGLKPGEASGGATYLPVTDISRQSLLDGGGRFHKGVESASQRLADIIYGGDESEDTSANVVVEYCFREVIRNVFEHAEASLCTVMAQRWGDGTFEVAVIDAGRGIHASLSERYEGLDPEAALRHSIRPGITRVTSSVNDDPWGNTGFGLYVLSSLYEFTIMSAGKALRLGEGSGDELRAEAMFDVPIQGTAIKVKGNTENAEFFPNRLKQLVRKGEAVAALSGVQGSTGRRSKMP